MDTTLVETTQKRHRGAGRVPFLANLDAIRQEVEQSWPLSAIYERFKDKLEISYIQFTRYVNRYIRNKPVTPKEKDETAAEALEKPTLPVLKEKKEPIAAFQMSDVVPNRDELI